MRPIIFKCTNTGLRVQALLPDPEEGESDERKFQTVPCNACNGMHLINIATGKLLGEE
jgi:hypothetical protein